MTHLSGVWFTVTGLEVTSGRAWRAMTVGERGHLDFADRVAASSTGSWRPASMTVIARHGRGGALCKATA